MLLFLIFIMIGTGGLLIPAKLYNNNKIIAGFSKIGGFVLLISGLVAVYGVYADKIIFPLN